MQVMTDTTSPVERVQPEVPGRRLRMKGWTWADWTIGQRRQDYGTLTIDSTGRGCFVCVTSATAEGAEPWWAGFSLETATGVPVHIERARAGGAAAEDRSAARCRWSFDFTYDAQQFDRIARAVQHASPAVAGG